MTTNVTNQKSDATTTVYAQTGHAAVSGAQLPSGFLPESGEPDPDDIDTVRIPLMIAGEEPDDELLARAEPIEQPGSLQSAPTVPELPELELDLDDETVEIKLTTEPPAPPALLEGLRQAHENAGFRLAFRIPPIGVVSIGLLLTMQAPTVLAAGTPMAPDCTFPDQLCPQTEPWPTQQTPTPPGWLPKTLSTPVPVPLGWWLVEQRTPGKAQV